MDIIRNLVHSLLGDGVVFAPAPGRLMISIFRPIATPSPSAWRQCHSYGFWSFRIFGRTFSRRIWLWGGYIPRLNVSYIACLPFKRG